MANPNIVNVTSIYGKTSGRTLGTSFASVVTNEDASNKVFKINTIIVSNVDGTAAADVTVIVGEVGGIKYSLASTISVPADSTLVVLDKASALYLEENYEIQAKSSASGDLELVISYEEIS